MYTFHIVPSMLYNSKYEIMIYINTKHYISEKEFLFSSVNLSKYLDVDYEMIETYHHILNIEPIIYVCNKYGYIPIYSSKGDAKKLINYLKQMLLPLLLLKN